MMQIRNLQTHRAAELTAYAFDNARIKILQDIESDDIKTSADAKNEFKIIFVDELKILTGGKSTCSASYSSCSGNIPQKDYLLSPFGVLPCISTWR